MRSIILLVVFISTLSCSFAQTRGRGRKVIRRRPGSRGQQVPQQAVPQQQPQQAVPQQQQQQQQQTDGQCPEQEGLQVYPHPDSCNHFYRCANGTLSLETCGNGLLFNEATSLGGAAHHHCSYNWQTDCGNRPNDTTPISSPGCEYEFGIFPSGEGCFASYTQCANGKANEVYCQLGLAYDHRIHTCNWPDLLVEYAGCDPSAAFGGFAGCDKPLSPLAQRFFPFPRFAVPKDPSLYIICVNSVPRLHQCTEGTEFSEATLGCEAVFIEDQF